MKQRVFSIMVILTILAASFVGAAQAAKVYLADEAGISAYANVGPLTDLSAFKKAFRTIEYQDLTGAYFIGYVDIPIYEPIYDPLVLVHTDGWIVAFYPPSDPAGKVVDVISRNLNETLLEKAVKLVGAAGGLTLPAISHYDFAHPAATNMLLVAEDKPDGNAFTLTMPLANAYYAKSYAFYQNYYPSFTLDNDTIDQVGFALTNADYAGPGVYGTIYGHFGDVGEVDFDSDTTNSFSVWSESLYAFGALAIEYSGIDTFIVADEDFSRDVPLVDPGLGVIPFDFTPSAFVKLLPENLATDVELDPTLTWGISTAPNYEYCIDTIDDGLCNTSWVATGDTQVSLKDLFYETTYYWQVRATNSTATVDANLGAWWSFTTADGIAPESFAKLSTDLVEKPGSASQLKMAWQPSYGAYYYEYCVDTTEECVAPELWHNVGLATTASTSELEFDTTYHWQVRAWNGFDLAGGEDAVYYTYADGGWFTFDTRTFGKLRPTDGAQHSPSLPLEWEPSGAAASYEYCLFVVDPLNPLALPYCANDNWTNVGTATNVTLKQLAYETTYYWQVRAKTAIGTYIEANDGDWWLFTTTAKKKPTPTLFKVSPVDGAVDQLTALMLDWKVYKLAVSYDYCYFAVDDTDTTPIKDDDTCTYIDANWVSTNKASDVAISGFVPATTYYWQVRANIGTDDVPEYVYGDRDEYWSFTTVAP